MFNTIYNYYFSGFPYNAILLTPNMASLKTRRCKIALTFLYKLIHFLIDCFSSLNFFTHLPFI